MKQLIGLACLVVSSTTYAQEARAAADDPIIITGAAYRSRAFAVLTQDPGVRVAATAMRLWPDTGDSATARRSYDEAVIWKGLEGLWLNTGDASYFKYVQHQMDRLVDKEGDGRVLLLLYKVTGQEKYYRAAERLRGQLKEQPGTMERLYMGQPFFAEYAALFHEDAVFADVVEQFAVMERLTRDAKTGLLYQRGDETARAMGWYGMVLVDALESYPVAGAGTGVAAGKENAGSVTVSSGNAGSAVTGRETLLAILRRYVTAVINVQDAASGCWWDKPDKPGVEGNYLEASASAMFVYTLAKGVRLGYLPASYLEPAKKGYTGILKKFVVAGADGQTNLEGTGMTVNDPRGMGTFLLAAGEMDVLGDRVLGEGKTVLLDYYFNSEHHKDVTGTNVRFHYTWEEMDNNGYSLWGHLFRQYGAKTDSLPVAPTAENLKKASVYIIVDPDNEKESPAPNFIQPADVAAISGWVNAGGVLVLLGNDSANMEFDHFNDLAGKFGIHFNFDDYHKVTGSQYEMGAFAMGGQDALLPTNQKIFLTTDKIYIKELSTLKLDGKARAHFTDKGNVIIGVAKVGRGTVFAVGDPWLYNEYTDGRKLPVDFQNFNAARDLTQWLIRQTK